MKNPTVTNASAKPPRLLRMLGAAWRWLIEPSSSIIEPERRLQARLLMTMLLVLMILGVASIPLSLFAIYSSSPGEPNSVTPLSIWITLAALLLLAIEYGLSRTIRYTWAAGLTVFTVLSTTFITMIINPGDLQYMFYLVLGGLIGSLFLSARVTAIVFSVTFFVVLLLPGYSPDFSTINDVRALFFILTIGGLVVMASILRQRYLEQIDWQTQQLVESEARLRELSIRDPLTGLFNRRYLEDALALEMIRAVRKGHPIGIIMADIDHFKRFNDTYGHATGDAVLVQVGNFLRTHVRSTDMTCRYGGEEFILVLPEATRGKTQMRAEQMLEDARHLDLQYEGQTLDVITLSLGVVIFPEHGSTYDAILGAVDVALYRAKHDGRDRVVVAE